MLSLQIDVDCTCFFDTEGFQHVSLLCLWTLTLDVPQMTQRSYHLGSLIVVFADDCQNVEMVFLNSENEEQSPFLFVCMIYLFLQ